MPRELAGEGCDVINEVISDLLKRLLRLGLQLHLLSATGNLLQELLQPSAGQHSHRFIRFPVLLPLAHGF